MSGPTRPDHVHDAFERLISLEPCIQSTCGLLWWVVNICKNRVIKNRERSRNLKTEKKRFLQKLPPSVNLAQSGREWSSVHSLQLAGVRASYVRCTQAHAHTKRVPHDKSHKYLACYNSVTVARHSKAFNSRSRIPIFLRTLRSFIAEYARRLTSIISDKL